MAYNKIVFLVETPILTRYYERYGIGTLRDMGFEVTIFDLSPLILPITYKTIKNDLCDYEKCGFKRFFSLKEFKKDLEILDNKSTLFICSMGYRWEYRKVFRLLKRYELSFCYFMQELTPTDSIKIKKSIKDKLEISNIKKAIVRRIPLKLHRVGKAEFILGCGNGEEAITAFKKMRLCAEDCPVYYFHSSNYEECLNINKKKRLIEDKYCVFVDQYLPYHPDILDVGLRLNPTTYYSDMNCLFDKIEKLFKVKVIIAAHPRSDYSNKHTKCFGNRIVMKNKTCHLIKDAEFVIYHFSNSMGYVTVFKKPVLIVVNEEVNRVFGEKVDTVCEWLGLEKLNIDEFSKKEEQYDEINKRLKINDEIYSEYVKKYMKKNYTGELDGKPLWIQIGEFIRSL